MPSSTRAGPWWSAGSLRHPVLLELEEDGDLSSCVSPLDRDAAVETAPVVEAAPEPDLQITRREKVFWPEEGITKGDLLDFYDAVWPWICSWTASESSARSSCSVASPVDVRASSGRP